MGSSILQPERDESRVQELLSRVEENLGHIPQAYHSLSTSQSFLNDTLYNLKKHMVEGELDLKTKHMIAIAIATVAGGPNIVEARIHEAKQDGLTDDEIAETFAVVGSIATYNTFYKFQHLAGKDYENFRPGFKLSVFLRPATLTKVQVELVSAMVSVVNSCDTCVNGHVSTCRNLGVTPEQLEEAIRVASMIAGLATFTKID